MRTTLTKRIVATAEPRDRPYEIRDLAMKGLILRVQPSGYRAFIVEWGRGKRKTLGYAAHLTLEDARAQTLTAMAEALHQKLPSIAAKSADGPSLATFLDEHYELWAANELRGGKGYVDRIRKTFPDLLGASLGSIDVPTIEAWWRTRVHVTSDGKRPVSKVTASRDLACLRSALSKAVEWRLIATNPLAGLKNKTVASRKVVRYLTDDEERRLRQTLAHRDAYMIAARESANLWRMERNQATYPVLPRGGYGDHLTPLVLLAMNTGLRRKELLTLQWPDIDLDGKMLTVRESVAKSGKQRFVPLNIEALAALTQWGIQRGRTGAVFAIRDAKTAWGRVLDEAGIQNFRFHDLRHHFASKLVRAHVDLNTVRELLGHADLKMTLRYSHLSPSGLAAAVEKLAA